MPRNVAIGLQDFEEVIQKNYFYIDKTDFIRQWWESGDKVTLIARPRRFGKTLNMSMLDYFFSEKHAGRGDLFEGLSVWNYEEYRQLQGTWPVINLSFANIKENTYEKARYRICQLLEKLYIQNHFLLDSGLLQEKDKEYFDRVSVNMNDGDAVIAIQQMCDFLHRYYGKKVIVLLDEYDTPMQEAYVHGFWGEIVGLIRSMFNSTFKTNPWLDRAIMTGITRVSKESIFSDLNNLEVVTTTADKYATAFGFTEEEVFAALDECGLSDQKGTVKKWYDGFTFGHQSNIYNPWSVLNFLDKGTVGTYWANTSSNSLVGKLIREGNPRTKQVFEKLLNGESIHAPIDEQIVFSQLDDHEEAIWSLLLASGYLKVLSFEKPVEIGTWETADYELALTNLEVHRMFYGMVRGWFSMTQGNYNGFVKALMRNDVEEMNAYMERVVKYSFSYFDTSADHDEPERFYHGFVLGLIAELTGEFVITSNRESGFGRYDVMLEPRADRDAYILEFKVHNPKKETSLEETVEVALKQIEDRAYEDGLIAKGIAKDRIRKYGFAFAGKEVLIG